MHTHTHSPKCQNKSRCLPVQAPTTSVASEKKCSIHCCTRSICVCMNVQFVHFSCVIFFLFSSLHVYSRHWPYQRQLHRQRHEPGIAENDNHFKGIGCASAGFPGGMHGPAFQPYPRRQLSSLSSESLVVHCQHNS